MSNISTNWIALIHIFRTLHDLSAVRGINETALVVSHDGAFGAMFMALDTYRSAFPGLIQLAHPRQVTHSPVLRVSVTASQNVTSQTNRLMKLKMHWWWLVETVFDHLLDGSSMPRAGTVRQISQACHSHAAA